MGRFLTWIRNKISSYTRKRIGKEIKKLTDVETIVGKRLEVVTLGESNAIVITITEPIEIDIVYPLYSKDEARNIIDMIAEKSQIQLFEIPEFDMRDFS